MKRLFKKLGALAALPVLALLTMFPTQAFALGWAANDMISQTTGTTGMTAATIDQSTLANWVQTITTFVLGIAIVIFVLKVVLTAIERMLFTDAQGGRGGGSARSGRNGKGGSFSLTAIPLIGAYPIDEYPDWKSIFIKFGTNVAVIAGAWVLVQIVTGVILFIFGSVTQVS